MIWQSGKKIEYWVEISGHPWIVTLLKFLAATLVNIDPTADNINAPMAYAIPNVPTISY